MWAKCVCVTVSSCQDILMSKSVWVMSKSVCRLGAYGQWCWMKTQSILYVQQVLSPPRMFSYSFFLLVPWKSQWMWGLWFYELLKHVHIQVWYSLYAERIFLVDNIWLANYNSCRSCYKSCISARYQAMCTSENVRNLCTVGDRKRSCKGLWILGPSVLN